MKSIRARLMAGLLGMVALAGALGAWAVYRTALAEADAFFDRELREIAMSLRHQNFGYAIPEALRDTEARHDFVVQVWAIDGRRIYLSQPHTELPSLSTLGFARTLTREGYWRTFTVQFRTLTLQVAQPERVRFKLAAEFAYRTLSPFFFVVPLLAIAAGSIIAWGLKPLDRLAADVRQRSPDALEPLSTHGLPTEVQPVVEALNALLGRLAVTLDAQRAFVADAAHELRTPLAALLLQAQVAARADDPLERQRMLGELEHGVRRASHLVEQLLTLARQDAHGQPPEKRPTRFDDLARTVVTNLSRIAEQRQLDLGVERAEPVTATVDPDAVETLLSNLVQNALRYTPPGGQVDVDAFLDADGAPVLRVTDTGPGIPVAERERVFDRFYRRENDGEGSGIGLAIVRRIADAHGAHVELSDRPTGNGLRVTVRFGKETAA